LGRIEPVEIGAFLESLQFLLLGLEFETGSTRGSQSLKALRDEAEARLARLVEALVNGGPMETVVAQQD
jgi:hypothetical protein